MAHLARPEGGPAPAGRALGAAQAPRHGRRRLPLLSRGWCCCLPMSLASLEAFLEQAHTDQRLQALLCEAPDAFTVAAIARAAGYPVSE
ncbi:MAG: Nif11-like leader peptide family natural product precursor, partial [Cyanobium sp.]